MSTFCPTFRRYSLSSPYISLVTILCRLTWESSQFKNYDVRSSAPGPCPSGQNSSVQLLLILKDIKLYFNNHNIIITKSNHLKTRCVPHYCNRCLANSRPQNIAILMLSIIGLTVRKVTISTVGKTYGIVTNMSIARQRFGKQQIDAE
jgi:hypothetical protein